MRLVHVTHGGCGVVCSSSHCLLHRLSGITPVIVTNCSRPTELRLSDVAIYSWYLNPIFLLLLFATAALDVRLRVFKPVSGSTADVRCPLFLVQCSLFSCMHSSLTLCSVYGTFPIPIISVLSSPFAPHFSVSSFIFTYLYSQLHPIVSCHLLQPFLTSCTSSPPCPPFPFLFSLPLLPLSTLSLWLTESLMELQEHCLLSILHSSLLVQLLLPSQWH